MTITTDMVEEAAFNIMQKAAIDIPDDYLSGIKTMAEKEDGDLSAFVLKAMLDNYEAAREDRRPMCADTGLPRYFVKVGDKARLDSFVGLDKGLRAATARATHEVPLRPNRCIRSGAPNITTIWGSMHRKWTGALSLTQTGLI